MSSFCPNYSCGPCIYCNKYSKGSPEDLLICSACQGPAHFSCFKFTKVSRQLIGDNFFAFTCVHCSSTKVEIVERGKISANLVVLLVLYDLHMTKEDESLDGYFHVKKHILSRIMEHWTYLFGNDKVTLKRKKRFRPYIIKSVLTSNPWMYIAAQGANMDNYFKLSHVAPPAMLLRLAIKKKRSRSPDSVTNIAFPKKVKAEENSECEESSSLSNIQKEEGFDEVVENFDESSRGSWFTEREIIRPGHQLPMSIFDDEEELNPGEDKEGSTSPDSNLAPVEQPENDQIDVEVDDTSENESVFSSKSSSSIREPPPILRSLFSKNEPVAERHDDMEDNENLCPLSVYEERCLLRKLDLLNQSKELSLQDYQLRRKLKLREEQRSHGLPVFNIDAECRFLSVNERLMTSRERQNQVIKNDDISFHERVLDRFYFYDSVSSNSQSNFRIKLIPNELRAIDSIYSPYTLRTLKPYIFRDDTCRPLKLKLLHEIFSYVHQLDPGLQMPSWGSIDYCYVSPQHIPLMNQMARQFFWPCIDLSDVLKYPDYTCVVLYKKLLIGFGVLVPDVGVHESYLSFLLVHPEWRRAGIAKFIMYHLIQTSPGKDITLHVSATNPGLIMYQQFGFKVEEFLTNFYDKYLPIDSPQCKHAMFMRLAR